MENNENIGNFEFKRLFNIINSKKLYIILIILICITLGYMYSFYYKQPLFQSSTTVILAKTEESQDTSSSVTQGDITLNQKLVSTYSQILKSNKVLSAVIGNLGLSKSEQELNSKITVSAVSNTEILKIVVRDENPEIAAAVANELVEVFSKEVTNIYNINNVNVIDKAKTSTVPSNINHAKDIIMFFAAGIGMSFVMILGIYFFDTSIKDEKDVEEYIKTTVLTTIPLYNNTKKKEKRTELITEQDAQSPIAEYFRTLKMNLTFKQTENTIKTILITSGSSGEGKSWTSANLAVILSQADKRVLLIDADMRNGRQNRVFDLSNNQGLSNCLAVKTENEKMTIDSVSKYIKETKIPNVHIITNGNMPPNPSELLSSERMQKLLDIVKEMYDIIVIDGTPCKIVSDSIGLANMVNTTVIVAESKKTKIEDVQNIKKQIENVGGIVAGIVLNKVHISPKVYKNSYYYGDHGKQKLIPEEAGKLIEAKTVQELVYEAKIKGNINLVSQEVDPAILSMLNEESTENQSAMIEELKAIKGAIKTFMVTSQNDKNAQESEKITLGLKLEELKNNILSNLSSEMKSNMISNNKEYEEMIEKMNEKIILIKEDLSKAIKDIGDQEKTEKICEDIEQMKALYESQIEKSSKQKQEITTQLQELKQDYIEALEKASSKEDVSELYQNIQEIKQMHESQETINKEQKQEMIALNNELSHLVETLETSKQEENIINEIQEQITNLKEEINVKLEDANRDDWIGNINNRISELKGQYDTILEKVTDQEKIDEIYSDIQDMNKMYQTQTQINQDQQEVMLSEIAGKMSQLKQEVKEQIASVNASSAFINIENQISGLKEQYEDILDRVTDQNKVNEIYQSVQGMNQLQEEQQEIMLNQLQLQMDHFQEEIQGKIEEVKRDPYMNNVEIKIGELKEQYETILGKVMDNDKLDEITENLKFINRIYEEQLDRAQKQEREIRLLRESLENRGQDDANIREFYRKLNEVSDNMNQMKESYIRQEAESRRKEQEMMNMKQEMEMLRNSLKEKQEAKTEVEAIKEVEHNKVVNINEWKQNENHQEDEAGLFKNIFKKQKKEVCGNELNYEDLEDTAIYTCQILNPTSRNVI